MLVQTFCIEQFKVSLHRHLTRKLNVCLSHIHNSTLKWILFKLFTVFAGVKAAVFLEEKISKSRGAAYAAKE